MMKWKENTILKTMCHILIPVCMIVAIISLAFIYVGSEWGEIGGEKDITKTETFAGRYLSKVENVISNINNMTKYESNEKIEKQDNNIYYNYEWPSDYGIEINFVMINNETKEVYTNYKKTGYTDTLEGLLNKINIDIKTAHTYWTYKDGKVETWMPKLELEEIKYHNFFASSIENKYTIYTGVKDWSQCVDSGTEIEEIILYKIMSHGYEFTYIALPVSVFIGIISFIYLTIGIGHKRKVEGIYLNGFDKIPLEVVAVILFPALLLSTMVSIRSSFTQYISQYVFVEIAVVFGICYFILWVAYTTFVRRIKSKTLWENTILYRIWKWSKNTFKELFQHFHITLKVGILFSVFVVASGILCLSLANGNGMAFFLLFILYIITFLQIMKIVNKGKIIKEALHKLYKGEENTKLEEEEFKGEFKEVVFELNDIAAGFHNAIEEKLKSERLKTELITNVSHDIKTPLTSIINYTDLLKKEGLDSTKADEYLKIIDEKSYKLKKLTEDLVEVSKASSGNIKLNLEKIDANELMNQMLGDFEDKLKEKEIETVITMPKEKTFIKADGKSISRVFQNLFCNISKYAMPNTRVYIDIDKEDGMVKIKLKNISKEKLNISAEELMQRFVRGDSSRNTERKRIGIIYSRKLGKIAEWKI